KEYVQADIQFFKHAFAYLLQRLLSDAQETTKTTYSNPKGWVEVAYMFALTSPGDSIAVDALRQHLVEEGGEDAEKKVSNDVIGPVTDGPDADEDRANDEGMVEAGKGRWQNSKSLDKGKNKAKPKSRKGPRESKAGRVP
ncbi:unnamed protein product, partial [Ascophyllum nodosum]